jgi:hypothetical protein
VTKDGCSGWVNGVPTAAMDAPTAAMDAPTVSTGAPTVSTGAQMVSMDAPTVSTDAPMASRGVPTAAPNAPTAVTNAPIPARPIGAHCCAGRWPPGPSVPPSVASLESHGFGTIRWVGPPAWIPARARRPLG